MRITILIIVLAAFLAGCTAPPGENSGTAPPGVSSGADERVTPDANRYTEERFARPGQPQTSPSGDFVAHAELGPEQNGVPTWIVVITDRAGREVFRDSDAYRSRPGIGITWLTGEDELWLLSSDVGASYVQQDEDGGWSKERPRPDHYDDDVPAEIRELDGR